MRKLLILSFFLPVMAWAQSSLPPCPETGYKHNCLGTITSPNGNKYVGEFRDGKVNGLGINYFANGSVNRSGMWADGNLVQSYVIATNRFPFSTTRQQAASPDQLNASANLSGQPCSQNASSTLWNDCVGSVVDSRGYKYVGGFKDGSFSGDGIEYRPDGTVNRSGLWNRFGVISAYAIDLRRFPFNPPSQIAASPTVDPSKAERDHLVSEVEAERKKREALEARLAAAEAKERERLLAEAKEREQRTPTPPTQIASPRNPHALIIGNAAYPGSARLGLITPSMMPMLSHKSLGPWGSQ